MKVASPLRAASAWTSKLQSIQSNPEVRLQALLDVSATLAVRPRDGCRPHQRWHPLQLLPKLLGSPDLSGLHVRLDARGAEDRVPARDGHGPVSRLPACLHLAVVEGDPQPRLAWRPVYLVDQLAS